MPFSCRRIQCFISPAVTFSRRRTPLLPGVVSNRWIGTCLPELCSEPRRKRRCRCPKHILVHLRELLVWKQIDHTRGDIATTIGVVNPRAGFYHRLCGCAQGGHPQRRVPIIGVFLQGVAPFSSSRAWSSPTVSLLGLSFFFGVSRASMGVCDCSAVPDVCFEGGFRWGRLEFGLEVTDAVVLLVSSRAGL